MFRLNDSLGEKHEIGNSITCNQLVYASMHKYIRESEKNIENNINSYKTTKLTQLKLFYERDECLIAIQFVLTSKNENGEIISYVYTEPKILGPVDTYFAKNNIDEIVLNISPEEEIYLIKGHFNNTNIKSGQKMNRIDKMLIFTTFGQYVEFGKSSLECNFSWEYYFNLRYFDGFIIGWDENHINYLASLIVEKPLQAIDEKNVELTDTTYESRIFNINPIYLTSRFGRIDSYSTIEDDLTKNNIFNLAKNGEIFVSEIVVYYDKFINAIEIEYTNKNNLEHKIKCLHTGTENKKSILQLTQDDCVTYIKFTFDNFINTFYLKTLRGKTLQSGNNELENKVEIFENAKDRYMNILGFIIGHQECVSSIQFYYENINK